VLKAYVDKQRRIPNKMVEQPKTKNDGKVDIGALWTMPDNEKLEGGRFSVKLPKKSLAVAAAAPGIMAAN
jgi:hypothetical protein